MYKYKLYLLVGEANIEAFESENFEEVNINASEKFCFTTLDDKANCIEALHFAQASYLILTEDEYNSLQ